MLTSLSLSFPTCNKGASDRHVLYEDERPWLEQGLSGARGGLSDLRSAVPSPVLVCGLLGTGLHRRCVAAEQSFICV